MTKKISTRLEKGNPNPIRPNTPDDTWDDAISDNQSANIEFEMDRKLSSPKRSSIN